MTAQPLARFVAAFVAIAALLAAPLPAAGEREDRELLERGISLYDAGDYEGARQIFDALDVDGLATGPILYRLSFSRARTGDTAGAEEAQQRALAKLVSEMATSPTLEVAFYLSNTYRNLKRMDDARGIARSATDRVESGEWTVGDDGLAWFRFAKLYADQGRADRATQAYRDALTHLDPEVHPSYVAWARRYLAQNAVDEQDYAAAVDELATIAGAPEASASDLDRYAIALARLERWPEAVEAWKRMERADLQSADRARYCWRLAQQAAGLGVLPARDGEDREIRSLGKEDLEALMRAMADAGKAVREEIAAAENEGPLEPEERAQFQSRLDEIRGPFIAASLEYALRGLPIRETAFFGGYAPLIFHASRWEVAAPASRRPGLTMSRRF